MAQIVQQKRKFVVRIVRTEADIRCGGRTAGPFVVVAKDIDKAFRLVRQNFASYFISHVHRETNALECEGVVSDCTGELLSGNGRRNTYGRHPVHWHRATA